MAKLYGVAADYLVCRSDFPSGLAPDAFLVDLDRIDDFDDEDQAWSVKVPRRLLVVDYGTHEQMRRKRDRREPQGGSPDGRLQVP